MTHKHIQQYTAWILADHMVSFARERPLTVIAKQLPGHVSTWSKAYAITIKKKHERKFVLSSRRYLKDDFFVALLRLDSPV
jgi:hypothetical protein